MNYPRLPERQLTPPDDPPEPPEPKGADYCVCGNLPVCLEVGGLSDEYGAKQVRVVCDHCGTHAKWKWEQDEAVEDWNNYMGELREEGENRKAGGVQQVAEHNEEWIAGMLLVLRDFAASGKEFTVQDVRRSNGAMGIKQPKSPNAWGSLFSVAAKQGLIERTGFAKNNMSSAHARIVAVWRGKK